MDSVSPTRCMFSQEYDLPPELQEIDPRLWAKGKNDVGIMDIDPIVIKIKPGARLPRYGAAQAVGARRPPPPTYIEEADAPPGAAELQRGNSWQGTWKGIVPPSMIPVSLLGLEHCMRKDCFLM
ncbi:hypothetical protein NDU88_005240 [Pleurodeles waltl]|uniref:Uncharacterized protein n=1 Tax=Pleurodeles waltl TaxID=8319 RepID=A0AAV7NPR7_PLEWA|nr:hypothetical protein NDU88_005240 [Pleurodeles waltl]